MNMLFGFGAVAFDDGENRLELKHAAGKLSFSEVRDVYRTKTGGSVVHHRGYLPNITVKLWNIGKADDQSDADTMAILIAMLNAARETGINIAPRFEAGGSLEYLCLLNSDIEPNDLSYNIAAGQTLELRFVGKNTIPNMPTFTSSDEYYNVVDAEGDQIVDNAGNIIIARFNYDD